LQLLPYLNTIKSDPAACNRKPDFPRPSIDGSCWHPTRRECLAGGRGLLSAFNLIELNGDKLKVGSAVEDESTQDDEEQNRSSERPPIIFGAPWVGPPAGVAAR
jgi:hypothetical protein